MDIVLPKELAYSPSLPSLPECVSQEVVLSPVNGSKFGPSQLLQYDLIARGFIDPKSIYLRYTCKLTNAVNTDISYIKGTPVYTFFNKIERYLSKILHVNPINVGYFLELLLILPDLFAKFIRFEIF